jgi:hypothetical protein
MILKHQACSETNHGSKEFGRRERAKPKPGTGSLVGNPETFESGEAVSEHTGFHFFFTFSIEWMCCYSELSKHASVWTPTIMTLAHAFKNLKADENYLYAVIKPHCRA